MAIRVLLDHGVQQDRIVFVTFVIALAGGISKLRRAFPDVHIVCGAVDGVLAEHWVGPPKNTLDLSDQTIDKAGVTEGESSPQDDDTLQKRKIWVIEPGMGQIGTLPLSPGCSASNRTTYVGDRYYL